MAKFLSFPIVPFAFASICAVVGLSGCGNSSSGDVLAGDTIPGEDFSNVDTRQPEVVVTEEQAQVYQRQAEIVAESVDMTFDELAERWYTPGMYLTQMPFDTATADFMPEIKAAYGLGEDAMLKVAANGFVVVDNGSSMTHPTLYKDIFDKDLPVLITADSILYAVHKSYDEMLKQVEESVLIGAVASMLEDSATGLAAACEGSTGLVAEGCVDIDLYLTVARTLLGGVTVAPLYAANVSVQDEILGYVDALQPHQIQMFGRRYPCAMCSYDFSQFKPRGHYTDSEELKKYFKAMIWMGRTPMNITLYDRDLVAGLVLLKSVQSGQALQTWQKVDRAIQVFVGQSDNMTPVQFIATLNELEIDGSNLAAVAAGAEGIRDQLALYGIPGSRILSQIMMMDVMSTEPTPIPPEFQLLGQRFVIDSYVFSNVVYDRITWDNSKPERLMPDPLDAMFVLGISEALPLLKDEIDTWHYAGNLHVLRSMAEEYDVGFWSESMYNAWLDAIRALGLDTTGEQYPAAARTKAWAQRSMQTAMASWAELRHDTILYVKQSYTGESCEYPDGYVDPNPEFFKRMNTFALASADMLDSLDFGDHDWKIGQAAGWFRHLGSVCSTLEAIARAQLDGTPRTSEQTDFIKSLVVDEGMCGAPAFAGWYSELFYDAQSETFNFKPTVADVHTDPNSTEVLHVATGGANPMVMVVQLEGGPRAFVGPASSYYQFREPGFARLTDAEWLTRYSALEGFVPRPEWTQTFVSKSAE